MYAFLLFPKLLVCHLKIFIFKKYVFRTFHEIKSINVSKKVYVMLCNLVAKMWLPHVVITCKIAVCFFTWYLFWLTKFIIWQAPATK